MKATTNTHKHVCARLCCRAKAMRVLHPCHPIPFSSGLPLPCSLHYAFPFLHTNPETRRTMMTRGWIQTVLTQGCQK